MNMCRRMTDHATARKPKMPFRPEEDQLINNFVSLFGVKNWNFIERYIKGRTAKQCRDRYMNYLKPGISNNEWTQKDDNFLIELYFKFGPKWSIINRFFQNRNQIAIKNRFTFLNRSYRINKLEKIDENRRQSSTDKVVNNLADDSPKNDELSFNFDDMFDSEDDFYTMPLFQNEDEFSF